MARINLSCLVILLTFTATSCSIFQSHSHELTDYHKPIIKAKLKVGQVVAPLRDSSDSQYTCNVHGCILLTDTVKISYGLPAPLEEIKPGFLKAREETFPHANMVELGGCIDEGPRYAAV